MTGSLNDLIDTLQKAKSIDERRNAAIALSQTPDKIVIEALIDSLKDHEDVAVFSTYALVKIGESCVPHLIEKGLTSSHPKVRSYSAEILGELNANESAEHLVDLYHNENDIHSKINIIEAIGRLKHPSVSDFLIKTLDHSNNILVIAAALALHRKKVGIKLCDLLQKRITTVNDKERGFLVWALIEICDRNHRQELVDLCESVSDKNLRIVINEVIRGISMK